MGGTVFHTPLKEKVWSFNHTLKVDNGLFFHSKVAKCALPGYFCYRTLHIYRTACMSCRIGKSIWEKQKNHQKNMYGNTVSFVGPFRKPNSLLIGKFQKCTVRDLILLSMVNQLTMQFKMTRECSSYSIRTGVLKLLSVYCR